MLFTMAGPAVPAELGAGPDDYRDAVRRLRPGDVLRLAPGVYTQGLDVHRLEGAEGHGIVIRGAPPPDRTTFVANAGRNTVSIVDSAHVTISDLTLSGARAPVDAVKAEGHARLAHHVTLERLHIVGYDASQQNVAISTKCPTWNWVIRDNVIVGAGTGMYLGNSDGSAPFVRGTIEGNVILDTIGYNLQIKHQSARPALPGMPAESAVTVIRSNFFAKTRNASIGENARPNVLVGHLPKSGLGADDVYELEGNVFFENPTEALFQGEGNLRVVRNLFYTSTGDALNIRPHNDVPKAVSVEGNFIAAAGRGVLMTGGDPAFNQGMRRNAVFAADPVRGGFRHDNATGSWSDWRAALVDWRAAAGLRLSLAVARWVHGNCAASPASSRDGVAPATENDGSVKLCGFLSLLNLTVPGQPPGTESAP